MRRASLVLVGVAVLTTACAAHLTPAQQATAVEARAFINKVAQIYGVRAPYFRVSRQPTGQGALAGAGAVYQPLPAALVGPKGEIVVYQDTLRSPFLKVTLAHEMGHYLLRHGEAVVPVEQYARETAANVKAVEILKVVEPADPGNFRASEFAAFRFVYANLMSVRRASWPAAAPGPPGRLP